MSCSFGKRLIDLVPRTIALEGIHPNCAILIILSMKAFGSRGVPTTQTGE